MTERADSDEFRVEVGRRARRLREEAGLDIARTARLAELSPAEVEAIERGVDPDLLLTDLVLLAGALRADPGIFLDVAKWAPVTAEDPGGYIWVNRADEA